jgi:hypothetical protein
MNRKALLLFFFLGLAFTLGAKAVWGGWLGTDETERQARPGLFHALARL